MYNYLINFRPVLLGAPLQLGAVSARLVRLWVNTALVIIFRLSSGAVWATGKPSVLSKTPAHGVYYWKYPGF